MSETFDVLPRHPYSNPRAFAYARAWCGKKNNSCGVYLEGDKKSDCAHFIAHCLADGGIRVVNPDPALRLCPKGLAVRNVDLVNALRGLLTKFSNIKAIDLTDAIVGDVGFLKRERPTHAFMVCEPWAGDVFTTPKVWAHSESRCCAVMETSWRHFFSDAFRLEDG